MQHGVTK